MLRYLLLTLSFFSLAVFGNDQPILMVIGTRPEALKMIPLYKELKKRKIDVVLLSTGQHRELLDQVFTIFDLKPDIDLKLMKTNQDIFYLTSEVMNETKKVIQSINPSLVLVQGDTTTAFSSALAAFYLNIPVAHIEAGLRSGNDLLPFPEEMNRQVISRLATYHFAPTKLAKKQLLAENIDSSTIFVTGNTILDSLFYIEKEISSGKISPSNSIVQQVQQTKNLDGKICLFTVHRRESINSGLEKIYHAINLLLDKYPYLYIVYPIHPNPNIHKAFNQCSLKNHPRIYSCDPLNYVDLVYLLSQSDLVATDSGGIQEEAISLGKPTLVLRNQTDRKDAEINEAYFLGGTSPETILPQFDNLLKSLNYNNRPSFIYGSGISSELIAEQLVILNLIN